jgi:hypothetical protein
LRLHRSFLSYSTADGKDYSNSIHLGTRIYR